MMNHFADIAAHPNVERLGWTLIHFVWQAAVVALIVAMVLRVTERSRANARYIGLCLALLMLTAAPVITFVMVPVGEVSTKAINMIGSAPKSPSTNDNETGGGRPTSAGNTSQDEFRMSAITQTPPTSVKAGGAGTATVPPNRFSTSPSVQPSEDSTSRSNGLRVTASSGDVAMTFRPTSRTSSWQARINTASPWIVAGWIAGVLLLSAWHFFGWVLVHRLKTRLTKPIADKFVGVLASLQQRMGIRTVVHMVESAATTVPLVVGWFRPVLLMPASVLTGLPPEQFEAILAHELAHVRRHDFLVNVLQAIVETCLFYHPAVWWLSKRIRIEREFCADDEAAAVCESRECYARALVSLADSVTAIPQPALAASGGALTCRVYRLLGLSMKRDRLFRRPAWLLSAMLGMGVVCALFASTKSDAQPTRASERRVHHEPIHTVAKQMDGAVRDWKLQHFDKQPTVKVDGHHGYKVVLRRTWKVFTNPPQQQKAEPNGNLGPFILKHVDWEFVLFPTRPNQPPAELKSKIKWQKSTSPYHTRNIYLGEASGYSWFTHATIVFQDALREKLHLLGGDGRIQLAADGLGVDDEGRMTANSCIYILAKFGDDALPFIERAIEANKKEPWHAVRALTLHRTLGATRILSRLAASDDEAIHRPADYALIHEPFRTDAKSAYIRIIQRRDYLEYAGRACVQFGWKDAIPALEEVMAQPKHWLEYRQALTAKRALAGNPIPAAFNAAVQAMLGIGRVSTAEELKRLADARSFLVNSNDTEPAILSGIHLALFTTKGNSRDVNAEGIRILAARPRKPTLAFLRTLAARSDLKYRKQLEDLADQVEASEQTKGTQQAPQRQTTQQIPSPRVPTGRPSSGGAQRVARERAQAATNRTPTVLPQPAPVDDKLLALARAQAAQLKKNIGQFSISFLYSDKNPSFLSLSVPKPTKGGVQISRAEASQIIDAITTPDFLGRSQTPPPSELGSGWNVLIQRGDERLPTHWLHFGKVRGSLGGRRELHQINEALEFEPAAALIRMFQDTVRRGVEPQMVSVPNTNWEVATTPVTNAQYREFLHATGRKKPVLPKLDGFFKDDVNQINRTCLENAVDAKSVDRQPVVMLTREDALAYCKWLSREIGGAYTLVPNDIYTAAVKGSRGVSIGRDEMKRRQLGDVLPETNIMWFPLADVDRYQQYRSDLKVHVQGQSFYELTDRGLSQPNAWRAADEAGHLFEMHGPARRLCLVGFRVARNRLFNEAQPSPPPPHPRPASTQSAPQALRETSSRLPPKPTGPSDIGAVDNVSLLDDSSDRIAWGKPVDGLQAGIAYVTSLLQVPTDRVQVGKNVSVELIIKNVSNAPIQFSTVSPSFRVPTVVDAADKAVRVATPVYDGGARISIQNLKPGESVKLHVHSCSVGPRFPRFEASGYHVLAGPGKYRLSAPIALSKFNEGDWVGKLDTGTIELEVLPPDKKWLTQQIATKLKARAKDFSCKIVYVGLAQEPMRSAGLMCQSSSERFPSHWSTAKIDQDQAHRIIDYLATAGHLWRQFAEPLPVEETPMVSYFLSIQAGPGVLNSMMFRLPWPTMTATIRDLQKTVGGDAASVLAEVLEQPLLSGWHQMVSGKLLGVSVERQLYEREGHAHFYMKFRLTNRTKNDVFVDLDKYNRIFSPNQWGIHRGPERIIVDESRMIPIKLTPAQRKDLMARAQGKKLTRIPPGQSIDYFHDFNRSGRKDVEAQQKNGKFFIVSIDGQLFATDRNKIDNINLEWTNETAAAMNTEVVIPVPVGFQNVPANGRVIE